MIYIFLHDMTMHKDIIHYVQYLCRCITDKETNTEKYMQLNCYIYTGHMHCSDTIYTVHLIHIYRLNE